MIERTYVGEGRERTVQSRNFRCESCGNNVEVVGKRITAVRMKLPEEPRVERIVVWCSSCRENNGVKNLFG